MTKKERDAVHGGLSNPLKMRGATSYSLPPDKTCAVRCKFCYASKGRYGFPGVKNAMNRRYGLLVEAMKTPEGAARWVEAMAASLNKPRHRWHDAGDTFSLAYARMIIRVCELTPEVKHYCPTKRIDVWRQALLERGVLPSNLVVRSSLAPGEQPLLQLSDPRGWSHYGCIDSGEAQVSCPVGKGTEACEDYNCFACWDLDVQSVDYHLH